VCYFLVIFSLDLNNRRTRCFTELNQKKSQLYNMPQVLLNDQGGGRWTWNSAPLPQLPLEINKVALRPQFDWKYVPLGCVRYIGK
jgi:hypothetical protein